MTEYRRWLIPESTFEVLKEALEMAVHNPEDYERPGGRECPACRAEAVRQAALKLLLSTADPVEVAVEVCNGKPVWAKCRSLR